MPVRRRALCSGFSPDPPDIDDANMGSRNAALCPPWVSLMTDPRAAAKLDTGHLLSSPGLRFGELGPSVCFSLPNTHETPENGTSAPSAHSPGEPPGALPRWAQGTGVHTTGEGLTTADPTSADPALLRTRCHADAEETSLLLLPRPWNSPDDSRCVSPRRLPSSVGG